MTLTSNHLNAGALSAHDLDLVGKLLAEVEQNQGLQLVGQKGSKALPVPSFLKDTLGLVLASLQKGKSVTLLPEDEELTTQEAADFLGMSRPYLVTLLESGKLPFHKVGTHRRVKVSALLSFREKRDAERKEAMDAERRAIYEAGLDDGD